MLEIYLFHFIEMEMQLILCLFVIWPFHFFVGQNLFFCSIISAFTRASTSFILINVYNSGAVTCRDMWSRVLEHFELVGNTDWILEFKQPFSLNLIWYKILKNVFVAWFWKEPNQGVEANCDLISIERPLVPLWRCWDQMVGNLIKAKILDPFKLDLKCITRNTLLL